MRIIKRKKGKKEYFYLQHSFRSGARITTREIYLGKNIPKNIENVKEKLRKEASKSLYEKLKKIKKNFQKEWKKYPASVKERERQAIAIAFTYNTNAIEGSTITLEETREIIEDKISPNKPLIDIKETEAHCKIFLEMLDKKDEISSQLILEWHKKIFGETKPDIADKFRSYIVRVGTYIAPDWQGVTKLIGGLSDF
ncbi:MAG: hypothetical protein HZB67_00440, partial [Candidatus Aenigmarchaeota archaeon]|nr:hypothetical protein [Candidatus Aenigmarchaeota archaeon]